MSKSNLIGEFNDFTGGLITEASPLVFPEKACVDMNNIQLTRTGKLKRRLGFDCQPDSPQTTVVGSINYYWSENKYRNSNSYVWERPEGRQTPVLVVNMGSLFAFYDLPSMTYITNYTIGWGSVDSENGQIPAIDAKDGLIVDIAEIDNKLVVTAGDATVKVLWFSGNTIQQKNTGLLVRDFWGVESICRRYNGNPGALFTVEDLPTFNSKLEENTDVRPFINDVLDYENLSPRNKALYQGGWDASTNTPTLSNGTGTEGHWYIVTSPGSSQVDFGAGNITSGLGDVLVYTGGAWDVQLVNEGGDPNVTTQYSGEVWHTTLALPGYQRHLYNLRNNGWRHEFSVFRYWDDVQLVINNTDNINYNTGSAAYPPGNTTANQYRHIASHPAIRPSDPIAEYCGVFNTEVAEGLPAATAGDGRREDSETGSNWSYFPYLPPLGLDPLRYNYEDYDMTKTAHKVFWAHKAKEYARENTSGGSYVVDVLRRGESRRSSIEKDQEWEGSKYSEFFQVDTTNLPDDRTKTGATCVATHANRVFFSGFGSEVLDGDENSPDLSEYVLFSRIVNNPGDIFRCYQRNSPNSDLPDLLDDDGGFFKISGVGRIIKMQSYRRALVVFSTKGIWTVTGSEGGLFTANSIEINKVAEDVITSKSGVVEAKGQLFVLTEAGFGLLGQDTFGDLAFQNLTINTIKSKLASYKNSELSKASLLYHPKEDVIKITIPFEGLFKQNTNINNLDNLFDELTFHIGLNAWDVLTVPPAALGKYVGTVGGVPQYTYFPGELVKPVLYKGTDTDTIFYPVAINFSGLPTVDFAVDFIPNFTFHDETFQDYVNASTVVAKEDPEDIFSFDGGRDAEGYLLTGAMTAGDYMRKKGNVYLSFKSERVEKNLVGIDPDTGITTTTQPFPEDYDLAWEKEGAIVGQVVWDWHYSKEDTRWGNEFEAYKIKEVEIIDDANLETISGETVVTTTQKVSGSGTALSLQLRTEPGRAFNLLGWSVLLSGENNI